jgi:hypothetical protein
MWPADTGSRRIPDLHRSQKREAIVSDLDSKAASAQPTPSEQPTLANEMGGRRQLVDVTIKKPVGLLLEAVGTRSRPSCLHEANDDLHAEANIGKKHNGVASRVTSVPFDLAVWNVKFSADINVRPTQRSIFAIIRNPTIRSTSPHADIIAPIGVRFAATRDMRIIRSHQGAKPLAHDWISSFPLPVIFGIG